MPTIFYKIFNNQIKITDKVLEKLREEIENIFSELKNKNDVDNLKVLKNKLIHLLEEKGKDIDKKLKKAYKSIKDIVDDIEDFIKEQEKEVVEVIDVVKKIEDKYKVCKNISPEKRNKYKKTCTKKSEIKYEKDIIRLQVELLKLQKYIKESGEKLVIIFEGRDAAGKGGTIKRFREYLNPRGAEVVALEKPTDKEKTQWYFQRYINYLPSAGEIKFFDRSWYNRAGVEPVMGFVSKKKYEQFLKDTPKFEKMLVDSGIKLIKFYFSVSKEEQAKRFNERRSNPLKQFKLSPIDQYSQQLWEKYTLAEYKNFKATHTNRTPWIVIRSDDKKRARLNAIRYLLNQFNYPDKIDKKHFEIDPEILCTGEEKAKVLKNEINTKKDLFD